MRTHASCLRHSGMGIASFLISLVAGMGLVLLFGIADVAQSQPGGLDEEALIAGAPGMLLLAVLAQIIALGLGIAELVQARHSILFGALGTVFASTALVCSLLLVLIGTVLRI